MMYERGFLIDPGVLLTAQTTVSIASIANVSSPKRSRRNGRIRCSPSSTASLSFGSSRSLGSACRSQIFSDIDPPQSAKRIARLYSPKTPSTRPSVALSRGIYQRDFTFLHFVYKQPAPREGERNFVRFGADPGS